jgi:hypothetical protein
MLRAPSINVILSERSESKDPRLGIFFAKWVGNHKSQPEQFEDTKLFIHPRRAVYSPAIPKV